MSCIYIKTFCCYDEGRPTKKSLLPVTLPYNLNIFGHVNKKGD